jgi:glyoxalase family protein
MELAGIHHLTAVTADAPGNLEFYTRKLGMRLVKKTVNQDDVTAYHLFYADARGTPGTDLTFFDWPATPARRGTRSIVRTGLRIAGEKSMRYWAERLSGLNITHSGITEHDGRAVIEFEDHEGQRLSLVDDSGQGTAHSWDRSPVPPEHQVRGLGPITISVPDPDPTDRILTRIMQMRQVRRYTGPASDGSGGSTTIHVYEMGEGGPAAELHVIVEPELPPGRTGAGGVHHVAFRIPTFEEYGQWDERLQQLGIRSSGPVDRFYFRSLYFREPNGILFELATDGPGFDADEPLEQLGERLALPPFLEPRRREIEAGLKPL